MVVRVEFIPVCFIDQHESQDIVMMESYKAIQNLVFNPKQLFDLCLGLSKFLAAVSNPRHSILF